MVLNLHTVLVAHNGFVFDFRILAAEVERRNLELQFNRADLGFADTLYELQKVCYYIKPWCMAESMCTLLKGLHVQSWIKHE